MKAVIVLVRPLSPILAEGETNAASATPAIERHIVLLTRIPQIDRNFTHLGRRFWYKNQYIAAVLGLGHGVPDG